MKSYLITGGAGFIGSHLADKLLAQGHKVYSIDNLSTGSIKNIELLKGKYGDRIVHHTKAIEDAEELVAELVDASDVIYHLAAAVGVKLVVEQPTRTLETNSLSTEIVLKHAAKKGKRVIFASTSEVYGKGGDSGPLSEESDLLLGASDKSRWSYAVSKLFDEHLALAYYKEKELPVTVVRFFNTVGPRQIGQYGMVIPRFVGAALANKPIQIYGDGEQKRCFCYVGDVVDALIAMAEKDESIGQIYNLGNAREVSIKELANLIKTQLGSSSEITFTPYEQAYKKGFEDMKRRIPNAEKIKTLLNWEATTPLEETIRLTAEWMKSESS